MTRKEQLIALRDAVRDDECSVELTAAAFGVRPDDRHLHAMVACNGSLDAARALHDALLPGWVWNIVHTDIATVRGEKIFRLGRSDGNPARAWLLAILEALIAQEADQ